jgi:DNA integrity scanning protein DisA with diadenylate cyclase activity
MRQLAEYLAPPPDEVRNMLSKLGDVPRQAEQELKTLERYRDEVKKLRSTIRELNAKASEMLTRAEANKMVDDAVEQYVRQLARTNVSKPNKRSDKK